MTGRGGPPGPGRAAARARGDLGAGRRGQSLRRPQGALGARKARRDRRLAQVVYQVLETVRMVGVMIAPFMPSKAAGAARSAGPRSRCRPRSGAILAERLGRTAARTRRRGRAGAVSAHRQGPGARGAREARHCSRSRAKPDGAETQSPRKPRSPAERRQRPATTVRDRERQHQYDDFAKVELRVALVLRPSACRRATSCSS